MVFPLHSLCILLALKCVCYIRYWFSEGTEGLKYHYVIFDVVEIMGKFVRNREKVIGKTAKYLMERS